VYFQQFSVVSGLPDVLGHLQTEQILDEVYHLLQEQLVVLDHVLFYSVNWYFLYLLVSKAE